MHVKRMKRKKAASHVYNPLNFSEATIPAAVDDHNAMPAFPFCGECSSSCAPPPPLSALHAISHDASLYSADGVENAVEHHMTNNSLTKRLLLRVLRHPTADIVQATRMHDLRTILTEMPEVTNVEIAQDSLAVAAPHAATSADGHDSCTILVEYNVSKVSSSDSESIQSHLVGVNVMNPQEAEDITNKEHHDDLPRKVTNRLAEAGFGVTLLPTNDSGHNTQSFRALSSSKAASTSHVNSQLLSVRSRLHITSGLCCPSEVPTIRNILKQLPGVHKFGVNVATKAVFVDHDPTKVTATDMKCALGGERFAVEILRDGGAGWNNGDESATNEEDGNEDRTDSNHNLAPSRFVESTLLLKAVTESYDGATNPKDVVEKLMRQNFFRNQVRAIHIHVPSRTLKVEHDPESVDVERVKDVLMRGLAKEQQDWGDIEVLHDGGLEGLNLPASRSDELNDGAISRASEENELVAGLKYSVVISGIFWLVSLLNVIDEKLDHLKYAGIVSVLFGMPSVLKKAWATIRRFQFDANCMMVIAAFGALALGEYDEAASVSFLFSISEWLETKATSKARRALGEIVSLRPDYAHVLDKSTGRIIIIPASNVPLGSFCSVRTGDKVPADGIVIEGNSSVDESSITGEATPVEKVAGSDVSAGSINVGSTQLVIKTTSTVGDSTVSRLIALVEEAQTNRSETENLVDSFAKKYTPCVLAVALLVSTVPWILFGGDTGRHWTLNGLIIIVIACPCALTISTPVTYSAGLAATAKRGIIIKGGSRLEALGNAKTVVFDKTGTLTRGRFSLNHLELIGERKTRREVLELLSIMEAPSSHPLSATLVSAAKAEGAIPLHGVSLQEHTILKGEGVCAIVNDRRVYVGNERLFKRLGMYDLSPHHVESARKWNNDGGTVGYVGIEGEGLGIIAMFCVTDTIRDEAHHVVTALMDNGVKVVMLTGDGEGAALAVGEEIGLPDSSIQSQLLPEDKLHYVSALKDFSSQKSVFFTDQRNLVVFVGDGVNDAASLAVADVGVAMGHGAALALEMSDVTLMDSNLNKLLFSMKMGTKVITTVKENIIFSLVANATAIGLTFAGKMTLLLAIVCDVGVMLLVTLNGMKLLSERTIKAIDESSITKASSRPEKVTQITQNGYEVPPTEVQVMEIV
ncbi:hypothetical protein HJC23_013174 [Cyclotella cryptica]|uniref:HMA domain-containing protein n=1 Tax=Cyclotella cryptica TaxID=29204 RepID=A0ABD3QMQ3_9STRA|eukprot:CCRYP_003996-RC/>CCRYP_003996-RC protein AED:0.04 eAED:0.04 QI:127/1/1/1/1/1/5/144/1149